MQKESSFVDFLDPAMLTRDSRRSLVPRHIREILPYRAYMRSIELSWWVTPATEDQARSSSEGIGFIGAIPITQHAKSQQTLVDIKRFLIRMLFKLPSPCHAVLSPVHLMRHD